MSGTADVHVPRRRPGLTVRHGPDGAVIIDRHGHHVASLDATAAALWELCDGETDVDEITAAVCTVWDVDVDVARRDVLLTLRTLREAGVLAWKEGP